MSKKFEESYNSMTDSAKIMNLNRKIFGSKFKNIEMLSMSSKRNNTPGFLRIGNLDEKKDYDV